MTTLFVSLFELDGNRVSRCSTPSPRLWRRFTALGRTPRILIAWSRQSSSNATRTEAAPRFQAGRLRETQSGALNYG
jgi:hypothetical protein